MLSSSTPLPPFFGFEVPFPFLPDLPVGVGSKRTGVALPLAPFSFPPALSFGVFRNSTDAEELPLCFLLAEGSSTAGAALFAPTRRGVPGVVAADFLVLAPFEVLPLAADLNGGEPGEAKLHKQISAVGRGL